MNSEFVNVPEEGAVSLGRALVQEIFSSEQMEGMAGCHVTEGVMTRSAVVRVFDHQIRYAFFI